MSEPLSPATEAIIKAILDKMELRYRTEYEKDVRGDAKRKYDTNKAYAEIANADSKTGEYIWLTINPVDGIDHEVLVEKAHKAFKKKWITHGIYTIEQRSEELINYFGFHIHALVYRGRKSPYECRRELSSSFRTLCAVDKDPCFHMRFLDVDSAKEKAKYLLGIKQDKKLLKVEVDKKFREENDYPPYWTVRVLPNYLLGNTE